MRSLHRSSGFGDRLLSFTLPDEYLSCGYLISSISGLDSGAIDTFEALILPKLFQSHNPTINISDVPLETSPKANYEFCSGLRIVNEMECCDEAFGGVRLGS
ncbi:MAG: hypothetical protein HC833_24265 [Leptolyngbyaceae cyanobacterium RM1_406_9]|nr:hypothetical protein [Leptolyngbyaceae cyanobacterium RM1_406_9]